MESVTSLGGRVGMSECPICRNDHRVDRCPTLTGAPTIDRMEVPDGWSIDGDSIERLVGDLRVRVSDGELVIEGGDVEHSLVAVPLVVVHAAAKVAEVTEIINQERSRLLAERFEGR